MKICQFGIGLCLLLVACAVVVDQFAFAEPVVAEANINESEHVAVPFEFQNDDVVAIFGNGLADRMQHDPWVETVLQANLSGKNVRFRNMSFSGDRVNKRPRSRGFTNDTEYLQHVAPSVVFVMYGYNESHTGAKGTAAYQKELIKLVQEYRGLRKQKGVDLRVVLFSPIAYEKTGSPYLPEGTELNENLKAITEATRQAAIAEGVTFVDLYTSTLQLFDDTEEQLTLNGIHLNNAGYQALAGIISQSLLGKPAPADDQLAQQLYTTIEDKNWHWHNRYRATDGNDVWGSRSTLSFVDGQTNAEVLKRELEILDVMTANRDNVIWAAANGKMLTADDSNVPPSVEVISNVGGGSRSSKKEKEGSLNYRSPEESLKAIKIPDGFELNVFASEEIFPDLANPVQLQVDAKGRLWAASWNSYPKWEPGDELKDSLMIFEDTDNDGVADKRKIFAHVHNPLGFEFCGGGVVVTSGPDLIFLKDTDGDDVADVRYPLLQGLGTSDTHHAANNLVFGPDGGIYWQSGIFLVHNHESPWGPNLNTGESGLYRFDPKTFAITPIAANSPNPHGTSFDRWGYLFCNDGTGGRSYQVRPFGKGFKMHKLLEKQFRPVPANGIISSTHFPDEMQDDFMICNVIGFLGVKQYKLDRGDGGKRPYGEVWGTPARELMNSSDPNFRPADAEMGADGALYVADWHNMIIGHMQHNIRDPSRDHKHGRIYRMTVKGRPLQEPVAIADQPIEALLDNLKHPANGVRHRTRVELSDRDSATVVSATQKWMQQFDVGDQQQAHHLLEALWVHQQHHVENIELADRLIDCEFPHIANGAATAKHFWENVDVERTSRFAAKAESQTVRYAAPDHLDKKYHAVYKIGSKVFQHESHCATCHMTNGKGSGVVYPPLVGSPWVTGSEDRLVKLALHGMWGKLTVRGKTYDPARGVPPMTAFRDLLDDEELAAVLTFVRNTWGNQGSVISPSTVKRVRAESAGRTTFWKPEELLAAHPLEKELMDPNIVVEEAFSNLALEEELMAISPDKLAALAMKKGKARRGKELFYKSSAGCAACHDPPKGLPRLGPDLTKVATKMTNADHVNSLLRPSDKIDAEFAQVKIQTIDGDLFVGIRVSENDKEVVIRSVADPKPITILQDDIEDMKVVENSIMPAGLVKQFKDRQEFYDLMKYIIKTRKR